MNHFCTVLAVIAVMAMLGMIVVTRRRERNLLNRLNTMLDHAINGTFSETRYDESMLSALETRLRQYLSVCTASAKERTAEKEKINQLISDISHQTKTPVSNILLYAQLLCEQDISEESRDCAELLSAQAEKLCFLMDALIKCSRLETGIMALNPRKTRVWRLLQHVTEQIKPKAEKKNITVTVFPTDAAAVFDEKWTAEALYNIVENAIKYTPEQGVVELVVTTYSFFCRIDVKDTGMGISKAEQANIFRRFYRAQAVHQEEGIGIGLSLAREIVSGQGGYIKVQSETGKGAVFSIFLPME